MGSECSFTNMFLWRNYFHTYWTIDHDFLLIKVKKSGKDFFLQPFGGKDEDLPLVIEELRRSEVVDVKHESLSCHGLPHTVGADDL